MFENGSAIKLTAAMPPSLMAATALDFAVVSAPPGCQLSIGRYFGVGRSPSACHPCRCVAAGAGQCGRWPLPASGHSPPRRLRRPRYRRSCLRNDVIRQHCRSARRYPPVHHQRPNLQRHRLSRQQRKPLLVVTPAGPRKIVAVPLLYIHSTAAPPAPGWQRRRRRGHAHRATAPCCLCKTVPRQPHPPAHAPTRNAG